MPYEYGSDLFAAAMANDIDLILTDTPIADYWQQETEGRLVIIGQPRIFSLEGGLGIMVAKGNVGLQRQLNMALENLVKNGTHEKLVEIYFNTDKASFNKGIVSSSGIYQPA